MPANVKLGTKILVASSVSLHRFPPFFVLLSAVGVRGGRGVSLGVITVRMEQWDLGEFYLRRHNLCLLQPER